MFSAYENIFTSKIKRITVHGIGRFRHVTNNDVIHVRGTAERR